MSNTQHAHHVLVPVKPTPEMLLAGHHKIDWCRDGQKTNVMEDASQVEIISGQTIGTTCKQDLTDAWEAMLAFAPRHEAPAEGAGERNPLSGAFTTVESVGSETPEFRKATIHMRFEGPEAAERAHAALAYLSRLHETALCARSSAPEAREGEASPQGVTFDLIQHLYRQREFSERTFGPGARTAGVIDHIRKELREIEAAPADISEWIDVVLLALDGAWRSGAAPEAIAAALLMKQTRNEGRTWPDWPASDPTKAIEHDRSGEAPAAPQAAGVGEREALFRALRSYKLTNMGCEDDPHIGYPLVDLMSNDGTEITTGEEEMRVLADHLASALRAQPQAPDALRVAIIDIAAERQRQIDVEGWTPEHDDDHDLGELGLAAALYALPYEAEVAGEKLLSQDDFIGLDITLSNACDWSLKPEPDRRRRLVKAGALIVAEIERFDRAQLTADEDDGAADCPICKVRFKPDDLCLTDIDLGPCHAECLADSPAVDLDSGELLPEGAPPPTPYRYDMTSPTAASDGKGA